jgi:hypothetical protein
MDGLHGWCDRLGITLPPLICVRSSVPRQPAAPDGVSTRVHPIGGEGKLDPASFVGAVGAGDRIAQHGRAGRRRSVPAGQGGAGRYDGLAVHTAGDRRYTWAVQDTIAQEGTAWRPIGLSRTRVERDRSRVRNQSAILFPPRWLRGCRPRRCRAPAHRTAFIRVRGGAGGDPGGDSWGGSSSPSRQPRPVALNLRGSILA